MAPPPSRSHKWKAITLNWLAVHAGPPLGGGPFGRGYAAHDQQQQQQQSYRNRLAVGSQYMDPEEIDSILRIQWKSLHTASPYVEDYYYLVSPSTPLEPFIIS